MILVIDVKPEDILFNKNGRIAIKLHYYSEFSNAAYMWTAEGNRYSNSDDVKVKKKAILNVGQQGGLSLWKGV